MAQKPLLKVAPTRYWWTFGLTVISQKTPTSVLLLYTRAPLLQSIVAAIHMLDTLFLRMKMSMTDR